MQQRPMSFVLFRVGLDELLPFHRMKRLAVRRCYFKNQGLLIYDKDCSDELLPPLEYLSFSYVMGVDIEWNLLNLPLLKSMHIDSSRFKSIKMPPDLAELTLGIDKENYNYTCSSLKEELKLQTKRPLRTLNDINTNTLLTLRLNKLQCPSLKLDLRKFGKIEELVIDECQFNNVIPPLKTDHLNSLCIIGYFLPPWGRGTELDEVKTLWELSTLTSLTLYNQRSPRLILNLSSQHKLHQLELVDCWFSSINSPVNGVNICHISGYQGRPFGPNSSLSDLQIIWD